MRASEIVAADAISEAERVSRDSIRTVAGKMSRSDDIARDAQSNASALLQEHRHLGNPHIVRCGYCGVTRTLFRDEHQPPFALTSNGWRCEPCDFNAATQEIRF